MYILYVGRGDTDADVHRAGAARFYAGNRL